MKSIETEYLAFNMERFVYFGLFLSLSHFQNK